jgi:hypothetical protein
MVSQGVPKGFGRAAFDKMTFLGKRKGIGRSRLKIKVGKPSTYSDQMAPVRPMTILMNPIYYLDLDNEKDGGSALPEKSPQA